MNEYVSHAYNGLTLIGDVTRQVLNNEDIAAFLKLYLLLYVDDTIVLAETEAELQAALHAVHHYCQNWKLEINIQKTKIMVFSRGKIRNIPRFMYNNNELEVVFEFRYLNQI